MMTQIRWTLAACVVMAAAGVGYGDDTKTLEASAKAVSVTLPGAGNEAATFKTADGKEGWVRKISDEAIPTPAYFKGKIYSGGGYSSRTFVALNADSGKTVWTKQTVDNGPTSPVVEGKFLAYNDESCDSEVRDPDTGDLYWNEVTGGTLLTTPTIAGNALIIPHPIMQRSSPMADNHFRMLGLILDRLKKGDAKDAKGWDADSTSDVLTAPIAAGERFYFTSTDGHMFAMKVATGGCEWLMQGKFTSAPTIIGDTLAVTTEEKTLTGIKVGILRYDAGDGTLRDAKQLAPTSVSASANLGQGQGRMVSAPWDYQGPKIAATKTRMFNAPGNTINAVAVEDGKVAWRVEVVGGTLNNTPGSLTPPALGKENLYIGTSAGHILVLKQSDGSLVQAYRVNHKLISQPILADGNIYFGTGNGAVLCLKLGNKDADGWTHWGGNAQRNKVD